MKTQTTKMLVTSAVMIALSTVLSLIKVWQMPLGGSITLLSMLPICVLSVKYGVKWGLISAFVYGLVQIALDLGALMSWGMTFKIWVGCIVFDYILAYTVLGIAGAFRQKGTFGIIAGVAVALALRFVCHFTSGAIVFDTWCPEGWNVFVYSFAYNGAYMFPEMVFTIAGAVALFKLPQTHRLIAEV